MTQSEIIADFERRMKARSPDESGAVMRELAAETGVGFDRVQEVILRYLSGLSS